MTATLSFLDSDTCGMLLNLWLDPTDKQQPNLNWLTTWVAHYSAGIFFEVKDRNYSHHSKIIHSLNALPLLKCQGGNPTILWRFSNILCASTSYQKRHFAIDSMTHLKYINVFLVLFCFVYLIKTMFGVHSICKQCWPNYLSLFILVTVKNGLKMSLYMPTRTLGRDSGKISIHLCVQMSIICSIN